LYGISKLPPPLSSPLEGEDVRRGGYNLLYGISKFPLTYVSSPQGERMEVRGLI